MEGDYEGFSIREYTRNVRSVDIRKCCPFPCEFTGDFVRSLLPPLTVAKFRWWSHELASLLTKKSPVDPKLAFRPKDNAESKPCKKRFIGETTTNDLVFHKKTKTKKLEDYKVYNCEEQARERAEGDGECSLGIKERPGVVSPSMNKAEVRCFSYTEEQLSPDSPRSVGQDCDSELQIPGTLKVAKRKDCSMRSLDKLSIDASQCERQVRFSLQLCCSQTNRLSLCSTEDQSPKGMLESMQTNKFQPVVSERRLSHAGAESALSCFPGPHLTLERIKHALDLERKRHVSQVDLSSGRKHSAGPALARDVGRSPVHSEKHHMYFPAMLGLDETFTDYAHQSWLWRTTTLGENHTITSLDKSWNTTLLCDTSKDATPFPIFSEPPQARTYAVPDSELPPTILYPLTDKDLYFHESGLGQQLNSVTFSQQQQLPFPSNPEIAGLPSAYRNLGVGCLLPDAVETSFGLPFTSTTQSQLHWPHSSFENSRLDMSSINHPAELN